MNKVSESVLALDVDGLNLANGRLLDQLSADAPTMLVFLRHFG